VPYDRRGLTVQRSMDFRKALGGPDNLILLAISGLALIYVTTGKDAWSDQKWARAAGAASGAVGLLKSGKLIGRQEGWDEGYNTLNPALHVEEIVRFGAPPVVSGVINAGADRVASLAVEQLQGIWPGEDETPKPRLSGDETEQLLRESFTEAIDAGEVSRVTPDPRDQRQKHPRLPSGWRIDSKGRFRDSSDRVASDERRRRTLRAE